MEANHTLISNTTVTLCVLPHDISENQWNFYYSFQWWLEGFLAIFFGCVGIFLNSVTIWILLAGELAASFFNWLLVCLAVFDSFFLLNGALEAFRNHVGSTAIHNYIFVVFLYPFRSIVMCCSIYTTVMLALERYNAMIKPISNLVPLGNRSSGKQSLKGYFFIHWKRLLKYIGPIILLSTAFYIPKRLELGLETHAWCLKINETEVINEELVCHTSYEIIVKELRTNPHYNFWYINVANILVTAVIPLISLSYLNINIYLKFKEFLSRRPTSKDVRSNGITTLNISQEEKIKQQEKDMIQQTLVLFSIVILFCLFHVIRIALNVEEFTTLNDRKLAKENNCEWLQYWTLISSNISHVLLQINSSFNFVIYCYFNKWFRKELLQRMDKFFNIFKTQQTSSSRDNVQPTCNTKGTIIQPTHATAKLDENEGMELEECVELNSTQAP